MVVFMMVSISVFSLEISTIEATVATATEESEIVTTEDIPEVTTEPLEEPVVLLQCDPDVAMPATEEVTEAPAEASETVIEEPTPEPTPEPYIYEGDVELLACAIYNEAGGDGSSDLTRKRVGDVVLNRVNDPRFPNSIYDVLTSPGQYAGFEYGVVWPARAQNPGEQHAVLRAYRIAEELLAGDHSDLYGCGYIWQAGFVQGSNVIYSDGTYFGI